MSVHGKNTDLSRLEELFVIAKEMEALYGMDDPRTMLAVINAVEANDPGYMDRTMEEFGLALPAPSHVSDDGEPLFSTDQIAETLGIEKAEVDARAQEIAEKLGIDAKRRTHPIQ